MNRRPSLLVPFAIVVVCGSVLTLLAMLLHITVLVPWLVIGTLIFGTRTWSQFARSRRDS
ncbi:hypothetical protein ACFDTO_31430 [Microbacteriaceae bacterium 4G12]